MQAGNDIDACAAILARGGVVAFPTDTVYGMGADIFRESALERIYRIKGRSQQKPFLINVGYAGEVYRYVEYVSPLEEALMERFWPGQLTLLFSAGEAVPAYVLRGHSTIGIRIPDHPLALALLWQYPHPIVSTSVNYGGEPPLLTADEVENSFAQDIDYLLGKGSVCPGTPSTIVRVEGEKIHIVRSGSCDRDLYEGFASYM